MVAYIILLSALVVAGLCAAFAPRVTGHVLAFAFGAAALIAGAFALDTRLPSVLGVTLIVVGVMVGMLAYYSLRRSRAAWAALIAILAVMPLATLFGAPKIANLLHTSLAIALIAPGLKIIAAIALGAGHNSDSDRPAG